MELSVEECEAAEHSGGAVLVRDTDGRVQDLRPVPGIRQIGSVRRGRLARKIRRRLPHVRVARIPDNRV
jgi:hypothetical protein